MTRIVVLSTGGTIASRYSAEHESVVSNVAGEELVSTLGPLAPDVAVAAEEFSNLGSYRIDLPTAFELVQRIGVLVSDPEIAGVVVTHGTDTMEESAYLADLLLDTEKPVVFTGAQLHADEPDSDGPRNLADSIRVAACPDARGLGALIVFGQEIHAARDATKVHASRVGTFASSEHGKLGEIDAGRVRLQRRTIRRGPVETGRIEPRVDLIKLVMGSDAAFVRAALENGARGLVLEAFGRGNATPAVTEAAIEAIGRGIPVAVTSRSPQGRVEPIYGAGGGSDLASAGAIFCGDLSGIKARILLALLLGSGADPSTIRRRMELHGN
ncbi:asparaginase [Skermanella mucosa]|uniref:asparaginase n=1 Tax=Skermanella mucosa TaxID=1789672 RepID=UPI00192C5C40|nr:asparaginase [Skermanella mucosa]UEM19096.1 asparaginase [Skermanella mucosa]